MSQHFQDSDAAHKTRPLKEIGKQLASQAGQALVVVRDGLSPLVEAVRLVMLLVGFGELGGQGGGAVPQTDQQLFYGRAEGLPVSGGEGNGVMAKIAVVDPDQFFC